MDSRFTAAPIRTIPSASATPSSNTAAAMVVPDEDHGTDMPMSMTASMMLGNLPRTSAQALQEVEAIDERKGMWVSIYARRLYPLAPPCYSSLFQPRAFYVRICRSHRIKLSPPCVSPFCIQTYSHTAHSDDSLLPRGLRPSTTAKSLQSQRIAKV